jgi:hypothetical protein
MLLRLRDKYCGVRHAAMTGAAGDGIGGHVVGQLIEVFGVEVVGHFDHEAGGVLDRIRIGGEVVAFGLWISGVAELAVDTEVALILMHDLDDFVAGDVFRKGLEVGWIGARASGWARGLSGGGWSGRGWSGRGWSGRGWSGRGLGQGNRGR